MLRVLRTSGMPILKQLKLEEALLRASTDNWLLINDGTAEPAIVLGISGKPEELVHLRAACDVGMPLIKRFSGGGTVVVDANTVFVTLIMQQAALPHVEAFPRQIMEFTGEVYDDVFSALKRDPSSVPASRVSKLTHDDTHRFKLKENDYVFGHKKVAGNAQAITKSRWLHHTSFLWDYRSDRMALLREPTRRPDYRQNRKHESFLSRLISLGFNRQDFLETIEDALVARGFQAVLTSLQEAEAHLQKKYLSSTRVLAYDELRKTAR